MDTNKRSLPHHTHAFTLIEVVVVISTFAFILPIITIMLFIILRQQLTVARMTEVKRQGDQAITFMQGKINAQAEYIFNDANIRTCEAVTVSPSQISYFTDARQSATIKFSRGDDGILYYNNGQNTEPITNAKVVAESFTMECVRNDTFTHPIVAIDFTLATGGNVAESEKASTRLHFSTKIILRNR